MAYVHKKSRERYLEWLNNQVESKAVLTFDDVYRIFEGQLFLLDTKEIDASLVDECLDILIPNRLERVYPIEESWQQIIEKSGLGH